MKLYLHVASIKSLNIDLLETFQLLQLLLLLATSKLGHIVTRYFDRPVRLCEPIYTWFIEDNDLWDG